MYIVQRYAFPHDQSNNNTIATNLGLRLFTKGTATLLSVKANYQFHPGEKLFCCCWRRFE